jgi:ABC-type proline/glycine betaine transport system permease subunit
MAIAGFTLIPFLGWGFLGYLLWNTGKIVASYNQPWYWSFNNLFAWIELAVYSYAVLRSIKLVHLWRQRKTKFIMPTGELVIRNTNGFWYEFIKTIAFALIVMCIVMLLSAILEYRLLQR